MWRADASITAGVYNTQPKSAVRTVSAELWDSTRLPQWESRGGLPAADDRGSAGFDVQLIEAGELRASRRCVDVEDSRFVAESYRQISSEPDGRNRIEGMRAFNARSKSYLY